MCRLLFFLTPESRDDILLGFIKQATTKKNTPQQDNKWDADFHLDGYGFAWISENKNEWCLQKSFIGPIVAPIFEPPYPSAVIGHLRNQGDSIAHPCHVNTHPFTYKNYVFCHNGQIFHMEEHRQNFYTLIDKDLLDRIEGDTDSEIIFYMLLSFLDNDDVLSLEDAVLCFHSYMINNSIDYIGNFIWGDTHKIVLSRLTSNSSLYTPCSFYHDQNIFSSEPLTDVYELFPVNHLVSVDLLHGNKIWLKVI